ncbi:MAG: uncharacterized DUF497 family protein [Urechidicola sp.]|jgi:uncharacterized DUF497 family protein
MMEIKPQKNLFKYGIYFNDAKLLRNGPDLVAIPAKNAVDEIKFLFIGSFFNQWTEIIRY